MASLPAPIRATLGLLATALDAVQELKDHAPEIPMEAVGNSMQLSMRLQQQYVALLTRGDEFLATLRGAPEEPPAWATFDEPPSGPDAGAPEPTPSADTGLAEVVDDLVAAFDVDADADVVDDLPEAEIQDGPRHAGQGDPLLAAATRGHAAAGPAPSAPAKKVPAKKAPAKKVPAKKVPAKKVAAKKATAQKAPPTKAVAENAEVTATRATATKAAKKTPSVKASGAKRVAKRAAPALDSADPILARPSGAAKRGRPAKKAGPRPAAAPELDAGLSAATAGARHQSAFDLAETPAVTTDTAPTDTAVTDSVLTDSVLTDSVLTDTAPTDGWPTSATE